MQAVGLQTFIWNNNLRSAFLLAGFPVLLLVLWFAVQMVLIGSGFERLPYDAYSGVAVSPVAYALRATIQSLPLAIAIAVAWFFIAYFANQTIIDLATGAAPIERRDDPELYNLLENLCISRGVRTPTLRIIESDEMNAFASGVHEGQFSITVTRGLRERLTRDELEAVLGHELTHIINRDVRTMIIAAVFAGIISLVAQVLARMLWFRTGGRDERRGGGALVLVGIAAAALAWFLAIVVRMAISRRREFVADAGSVELTKNPDAMIAALRKIEGRSELARANSAVMEMCIDNPRVGFANVFDTHPSIEARCAALVKFAGGHDPGPLALDAPEPQGQIEGAPQDGPWSSEPQQGGKPFLPGQPPLGGDGGGIGGPWGPKR